MNKTFKGKLASSGIKRIRLSTNDGLTGYKIKKLQVFPYKPGDTSYENVVQVFSVKPDAAIETDPADSKAFVDFESPLLLACAYMEGNASNQYSDMINVVFDDVKINQDIYITNYDVDGNTELVNYYIELEKMKLDLNEATVATLKDMRGRE